MRVVTGTYIGDGTSDRQIDVGFLPAMVWVKEETVTAVTEMVWRTTSFPANTSIRWSADDSRTDELRDFNLTGFRVSPGGSGRTNTSGSVYHWVAFGNNSDVLAHGNYVGNGVDNRDFEDVTTFQPDIVVVQAQATGIGAGGWVVWLATTANESPSNPDRAYNWINDTLTYAANRIQNISDTGFQIGTDAGVNNTGTRYEWFAMRRTQNNVSQHRYGGSGADNRWIPTPRFTPKVVTVRRQVGVGHNLRFDTIPNTTDGSWSDLGTGLQTDHIQELRDSGIEVGTNVRINNSGDPYELMAFADGIGFEFIKPEFPSGAALAPTDRQNAYVFYKNSKYLYEQFIGAKLE